MYLLTNKDTEDWLIEKGYSDLYGARELHRTVQRYIVQPLAEVVTEYDGKDKLVLKTVPKDGRIEFEILTEDYFKTAAELIK